MTTPNFAPLKVADIVPLQRVQAAVMGKPGTGKTFGAATFPRPVFIDFDRGIVTVKHPAFTLKYPKQEVLYQEFFERNVDARGVLKSHNAFDDACKFFDFMMSKDHVDTFDTWVIDSATTLFSAARNKAIVLLGSPTFKGMSKTHQDAQSTGMIVPKMQDYGSERSLAEQFIRMVKDTPKHVLLLCHEKDVFNDSGALVGVEPMLTGQSATVIQVLFNNVWRLKLQREGTGWKRSLQTEPDGMFPAKSRLPLPDGTEFTFEAISKALTSQP